MRAGPGGGAPAHLHRSFGSQGPHPRSPCIPGRGWALGLGPGTGAASNQGLGSLLDWGVQCFQWGVGAVRSGFLHPMQGAGLGASLPCHYGEIGGGCKRREGSQVGRGWVLKRDDVQLCSR